MEVDAEYVGLSPLVAPTEYSQQDGIHTACEYYPFATVLRLRVLQIVFGITFLVMGTVAFIEEQGELNLSLAIPAGASTIVAAAASIHTSRGFGGYSASSCTPGSALRFLGPSVRVAVALSILWGIAFSFLTALVVQTTRTLANSSATLQDNSGLNPTAFYSNASDPTDVLILAMIELSLAIITILVIAILLRIDCKYDPD